MRNLKKVLSTIMAVAMMMSLVVFSTSAAFNDQDKIVNTDAVNMNVALNVINGLPDGSFNPTGNVTRAEMSKMICVLLNGGNDPAVGAKTGTATFKDIRGHWAEGYIEYCAASGIVAGMGDGTFAPNANVTATQAAKMLLVALGYDAKFEGFNGDNWSVKINVAGSQKNLYEDVSVASVNNPLSRDNAAQMVWNALNAKEVKYTYSLTTVNGALQNVQVREDKDVTLLKDKYNTGADYTNVMTGYTWVSADKKFTYTFADGKTFKSKVDYTNLFRMNTAVVYKASDNSVYGMYADDAKVLATGLLDDLEIDGSDIKFNSVKYKLDNTLATTKVYAENAATASYNLNAVPTADLPYTAKLIDNDNDGKVDLVVYLPFTVEKITYVDSKGVTTNTQTYKFDDCVIYDGAAKNDWAMIVDEANTAKGDTTLTKVTAVTGTISSLKSGGQIVMDGKTYTNAAGVTGDTGYKIGNKMELTVVNGFIFNAKKIAGTISVDKLAFVVLADNPGAAGSTDAGKQQVQLLFADGTKKVVKVAKIDGNNIKDAGTANTYDAGDIFLNAAGGNPNQIKAVYTYTVNKDGNYELEGITVGTNGNYEVKGTVAAGATLDAGKIVAGGTTVRFADDAVVFYFNNSEYKVATGAAVNTWGKYNANIVGGTLFSNESNGFYYTQVGYLALPSAPSDKDTKYGYIVAKPELVKDGDDYYYQLKIWNGTEDVIYRAESTADISTITSSSSLTNANVMKGTVVSFKISGDKIIEKVTALSNANAVTAYVDGGKYVGFQSTIPGSAGNAAKELKLTSDSVVIRYSSADVAGQAGNGITIAKEVSGIYALNCYVVANTDDEVEALIIDKDNAIAGNALIKTAADVLTDGVGINNNKIGILNTTSAALAIAQKAAIQAEVAALFTNELTVVVNDNGTTCTTATVYAPNGDANLYTLTMDKGAGYALATGSIAQATVGATAAAAQAYFSALPAAGNCTLTFAWTYVAGNAGALAATDYVVITATAPNGDVLATATYTLS